MALRSSRSAPSQHETIAGNPERLCASGRARNEASVDLRCQTRRITSTGLTYGLPAPAPIPLLPVDHQIAQKLHACTSTGAVGENERAQTMRARLRIGARGTRLMPRAIVQFGRRVSRARPARLAFVVAIGVAVAAGLFYWRAVGPSPSVGASPSLSGSPTAVPTRISEPLPTLTSKPATSPTAPNEVLDVPASVRSNVSLPAGAQVDTTLLVADTAWLVMGITFGDSPTTEALYAANPQTGALRKIRDASVFSSLPREISVAGSQAAWADSTCESSWPSPMPTEQAHPLPQVRCSSWRVVLTDLETGAGRVVAHGANPDVIHDSLSQDTSVPVVPTVALGDGVLAYTTGDLAHGIKLNLLTLSSGALRTLPLGGPLEEMRWAGQDLAWVEDADFHAAGTGPGGYANPYYLDSQLMVLANGATQAREIAAGAYWLDADAGEITWDTGGNEVWTVTSPYWQPAPIGYESNSGPFVSGGWLGWAGTWRETPFLVLGPRDSAPRVVPEGLALSGGWLILGSRQGQPTGYLMSPTNLEVVRLSDLN